MKLLLVVFSLVTISQAAYSAKCYYMTAKECKLFHEINRLRVKRGRHELKAGKRCTHSSRYYAKELFHRWKSCGRKKTKHRSKKYGSFSRRVRAFKVPGGRIAENLYCAPGKTVKQVANTFMKSSGHRKNLLNRKFYSTGVGQFNGRWVQCFSSAK